MTGGILAQAHAKLAAQEARATGPVVRLIRGDAVALEPVRWLWPGFLPAAMLTILGGAPGCGKNDHRAVAGRDRHARRRLA